MLSSAPSFGAGEILSNGGFEEGTSGWVAEHFAGEGSMTSRPGEGRNGSTCLAVTVSRADSIRNPKGLDLVNPFRVAQTIPAAVGRIAIAEAWSLAPALQGHVELRLEAVAEDGRSVVAGRSVSWPPGETWSRRAIRLYVAEGSVALRLLVEVSGAGEALVDDASLRVEQLAPLPAGTNLLVDPGFEHPDAWESYGQRGGATLSLSREAARTGSQGARIVRPEADAAILPNWGQEVINPGLSGKEVAIDGWFRAHEVRGRGFLAAFFYGQDREGKPFQRFVRFDEAAVSGTEGWVRLAQRVSLSGLTIHGIWVRACLEGSGTLDVDDMSLTVAPEPHGGAPWSGVPITVGTLLLLIVLAVVARRRQASPRPTRPSVSP